MINSPVGVVSWKWLCWSWFSKLFPSVWNTNGQWVNRSVYQRTPCPGPKVSESHTAMVCQSKNSGLLSNAEALAKLPQQSLIKWSKFRDPGWTLRIRTGRNLGRLGLRENALLMTCLPYHAPRGLQLWCLLMSSVKYLTCGSIRSSQGFWPTCDLQHFTTTCCNLPGSSPSQASQAIEPASTTHPPELSTAWTPSVVTIPVTG